MLFPHHSGRLHDRRFNYLSAAVLLYIGTKMVRDLLGNRLATKPNSTGKMAVTPHVQITSFTLQTLSFTFNGEQFDAPVPNIFALSLFVGIVGGIYGIGGGQSSYLS